MYEAVLREQRGETRAGGKSICDPLAAMSCWLEAGVFRRIKIHRLCRNHVYDGRKENRIPYLGRRDDILIFGPPSQFRNGGQTRRVAVAAQHAVGERSSRISRYFKVER